MMRYVLNFFLISFIAGTTVAAAEQAKRSSPLPDTWRSEWNDPSARMRPLQIVHGVPARLVKELLNTGKNNTNASAENGMSYYRDLGLGGIVCNVDFKDYMRSEEKWKVLVAAVRACGDLGMVVWLYDEDGYPSGAAGGLVLEEDPDFEALSLAYDPGRKPALRLRPAYEHTHASNNFYAARRYANLIDDRAAACFIRKTHEAYWARLKPFFGNTIEAFFTDEPSLIAVNLGPLPDHVRKKVRVADPLDESVKPLPTVPWSYDLPRQYKKRYGRNLDAEKKSLFTGETERDRAVRHRFWNLIADLTADRYFGAIQKWCRAHNVASSGHTLWEERILHHVPFQGNGLKVLGRMDIPGLDLLNSDPEAVIYSGWLTAGLPASAALLTGKRRVMTEVSDFSQKLGGQGPVSLQAMQSTAAWQAAWGVTDFTLYYGIGDRKPEAHREYCSYVGRLNSILKNADRMPQVLLYYPVYDLWSEYIPQADPLKLASQTQHARTIVGSFMQLGTLLQRSQVPFCLVDHEHLARAQRLSDGSVKIADHTFTSLLIPKGVTLPEKAGKVKEYMAQRDGGVITSFSGEKEELLTLLKPPYRITPASDRITLGIFSRSGRRILLAANVGKSPYQGAIETGGKTKWLCMQPSNGGITGISSAQDGTIPLTLEPQQAVLLVEK